jgi:hypothetical protein
VLTNEEFATWINENGIAVVGHNGSVGGKADHKPVEEVDPKTKEKREVCPSYAGITCADHQKCKEEAGNPPDGLGKIDFPNGVPNSWMVGPDGVVERMEQKDSMVPKSAIEALTAFQKKYEAKPVPFKKYETYRKLFADHDAAVEAGKWKDALSALVKVDADGKKLSPGLAEKVKAKAGELSDKAKARLGEIEAGDGDDASKLKAVKALRADVSAKLSIGNLAALADLDAWIKERAAAAAPAK